ncbi:class I tRNA ligase family protein [Amycolatopsis sp. NPDC049868]|uniref:class I tRNA ligase family protein n=1 Tax=Amycolatopsis sp. NPDC049868 TaxID=3363934 RepID=UPI0037B9E80A
MILDKYSDAELHPAFGIDMSVIDGGTVGAGWARVRPGTSSAPHQHDEIEMFVVLEGTGELVVNGANHPIGPGTVALFEPFETHVVENTGETDLVFADVYWRDFAHATLAAESPTRLRRRPLLVFSTPPTPNGDLHLGHLSGPYLGADVYVRFQRMNGADAWHLTGSDDFQSYVAAYARDAAESPATTAERFSAEIRETLALMDIEPDQFTVPRTAPRYADGLRDFFSRLTASGEVRPTPGTALFDGETGEYLYEGDVSGACPACGQPTGGNLCEECGEPNACVDLLRPRSALSPEPPRRAEVVRHSLPLHDFRATVADHHALGRVPARLRELADRLFSRPRLDVSLTHPTGWGVSPATPDMDDQAIWAWPEMAYGFLYGIEALGRRSAKNWRWDRPRHDWKIVHFFGFDNSFYHAVLYPALYRLAFPEWRPDIDYHVNEFYLLEEDKFSTSRRHAIWGKEILSAESVDAVRYFLASTRPEGRRTSFSRSEFEAVLSTVLIGQWQSWLRDLGARVDERYGGHAPDTGTWTPEHTAFLAGLEHRLRALTGSLGPDGFSLNQTTQGLSGLVQDARAFAGREEPGIRLPGWSDQARTAIALELAAARLLAGCAAPVMPRFARRLAGALGLTPPERWPSAVELLSPGARVDLAGRVFFAEEADE